MTELKDWLNSINQTKKNLIDEDHLLESKYLPYIINRCMSGHFDCVMYANEMNINPNLDKKLQYDFYLNTLRSKKRFSPWLKKEELKNLEIIKSYYGYSNEKAKQVLSLLTEEQITFIRRKLETGGLR
tara:strand:- start:5833 stop:6216 length:384 start_codon:yes stop_codon:yes gene_type:complete